MSTDSLSTSSSSSSGTSSKSNNNMHIAMPSSPFTRPANSDDATGHAHTHTTHLPHMHIATPHPLATTAQFLDKHVPGFARHHREYAINQNFRSAKREASHSLVHSPIPEIEGDEGDRDSVSTALHTATAAVLAPAMPDANRNAADSEAWQAVLAQREAARLRSGTDVSLSGSDTSLGSPLSKHEEESSPISP